MFILWLKTFHFIAIVSWFAGLFYLPRLFVYHALATDEISIERFKVMERRLLLFIMTPSMFGVILFGGLLLWKIPEFFNQGWMHAKLSLVFILVLYHHWCLKIMRSFANNMNTKSDKWYRWFNEVPTVLLICISILTFVKPF